MNKKYFIFAATALTMAACSSDDALTAQQQMAQQEAQAEEVALNFGGGYMNRSTTRAGQEGTLTTTALQTGTGTKGFGVFAYYTDGEGYNQTSKPNFMYNQQIEYKSSAWTYEPIKYWPNEYGTSAISDDVDRLSFFAYAPWVDVTPSSGALRGYEGGALTHGITGLTRNSATGDPLVKYAITNFDPAKVVDLCYGVYHSSATPATAFTSSVDGSNNNVADGEPYLNLIKVKTGDKIDFTFYHALAGLNVQIDADVDDDEHNTTTDVNTLTRIWVRSVTFEGFTTKGALNLNSTSASPIWLDVDGSSKISINPITIYDGRRDGKEGISAANNESPVGLNPALVQSGAYTATWNAGSTAISNITSTTTGVTKDYQNLFNSTTATTPIYVIPTGEALKVTIEYDVETADANIANTLADGAVTGSVVSNTITKEIKTSSSDAITMDGGKLYNIKLHLGMTSVKVSATVDEFPTTATAEGEGWLPNNAD